MQLPIHDFTFTLHTPCFGGTALGKTADHAEMRIPPIRGHVRFWHRALFGAADCNHVWGSTSGNEGAGSRVALRFIGTPAHGQQSADILPHDLKKSGRPRPSVAEGATFRLQLQRLPACTNDDWDHAQRAVKAWLLLGCLGLRSNRAAGSVWPEGEWVPQTVDALTATLRSLGLKQWGVALAGLGANKSARDLRETASDTISGNPHQHIFGGIYPQRKPSPTKFKVIRLGSQFCLLACAPSAATLREAEHLLLAKREPQRRWQALGAWRHVLP